MAKFNKTLADSQTMAVSAESIEVTSVAAPAGRVFFVADVHRQETLGSYATFEEAQKLAIAVRKYYRAVAASIAQTEKDVSCATSH